MQDAEMSKKLADKNVVVFRGTSREAIDMQLCKMGIVPYTIGAYDSREKENGVGKKFMDGLAHISEGIGKKGLERVAYKGIGGTGNGNRYSYNEQMNKRVESLSKKEFFDFFFSQNPDVASFRETLIEEARQYTDDPIEIYSFMGGQGQEVIDKIYSILGENRVNETVRLYNEKARAAFMDRYAKFVSKLPEREMVNADTQQVQPIEEYIGITGVDGTETIGNHVKTKTGIHRNIGSQIPLSSITEYAKDMGELFTRVEDVQSQNTSTSKVHGIQHVKNVLLLSNYLGLMNGVSSHDLDIIREAAIYHDISHEQAGDSAHAKKGASWYLENAESVLDKNEIAFLIEAHEVEGKKNIGDLVTSIFPDITEQRKAELIRCAEILQDADKLDILRYDIEKPNFQRFQPGRLNIKQSSELISAVIELNTRQAINKGFLSIQDGKIVQNENQTINPSQIGTQTSRAGIGLTDINQTTRKVRDSLSPDKIVAKGEEPTN